MALYNRLKEINSLIGVNLLRSSNLNLTDYYDSIQNKNSAAGFFTPFMIEAGIDAKETTVGDVLQRNQYFSVLDRFLSKIQENENFSKIKTTNNKDVLFTETGNVTLLLGDTASYGYPGSSVKINMVEVNDNITDPTETAAPFEFFIRKYRLVGTINLQDGMDGESAYILPLGIISNDDLTESIEMRFGSSNSTVKANDNVFGFVNTQFNNDCYVTETASGNYVSATNGFMNLDNTITGPGDFYVFLILSSSVAMDAVVNLDHTIEVFSPTPTVSVSFQTV